MPRPTPTRVRNHLCAGLHSRIAPVPAGNQPCTARLCAGGESPGGASSGRAQTRGDSSGRDGLAGQFSGRHCLGCHYSGRRSLRCDRSGRNDFGKAGRGRGRQQHGDSVLLERWGLEIQSAGLAAGDRSSQHGLSTSRCILPRRLRGSHQQLSSVPVVRAPRQQPRWCAEVLGTAAARSTGSRMSARKNGQCVCAGHGSLPESLLPEMMFGRARCLGQHCRRDIWCRIG
jgi:hypothetical protein